MKIHEEKQEVVGVLYTQGQEYGMLNILPSNTRGLHFLYRESAFEFYVIVEGFAQYVIVSKGNFLVVPLLNTVRRNVKFLVEDKEAHAEESEELPF